MRAERVQEASELIVKKIRQRDLFIQGVDDHGRPVRWDSEELVSIKLMHRSLSYGYRLEAFIKDEEVRHEVETEMIANGRRHMMRGDVDGDSSVVS